MSDIGMRMLAPRAGMSRSVSRRLPTVRAQRPIQAVARSADGGLSDAGALRRLIGGQVVHEHELQRLARAARDSVHVGEAVEFVGGEGARRGNRLPPQRLFRVLVCFNEAAPSTHSLPRIRRDAIPAAAPRPGMMIVGQHVVRHRERPVYRRTVPVGPVPRLTTERVQEHGESTPLLRVLPLGACLDAVCGMAQQPSDPAITVGSHRLCATGWELGHNRYLAR